MPDHAPSQELRTHVLEIRERMRTCRQRLLLHPEDESVRLAVDLEIQDIQTHCLHVYGKGYTIQGIPGFSCGECGLRTGAREGRWDPIPMSAWEKKVRRFRRGTRNAIRGAAGK